MNPRVKKLWLKALRSGKYVQGRKGNLRTTDNKFCCLGVLCDLYAKNKKMGRAWITAPGYDGERKEFVDGAGGRSGGFPTLAVRTWAGLDSGNPQVPYVFNEQPENSLATLNDSSKLTFKGIAKLIERHL